MKKHIPISIAACALVAVAFVAPVSARAQMYNQMYNYSSGYNYNQGYYNYNQNYYNQYPQYQMSYPYYQYSQYPYYQAPYNYQNYYYPNYSYPYNNYNNYNYYPHYNPPTPPLYVSCYPNMTTAMIGSPVTWTAYVSGGNGQYIYSWAGENISNTNASVVTAVYGSAGQKTGTVTVTSGNQTMSRFCGSVYVSPSYQYPQPYPYPYPHPW